MFQAMKKQMLFAFPNANTPLLAKGMSLWALFWQQKLERPKERGNEPKRKQTFLILNSDVLVFFRAG